MNAMVKLHRQEAKNHSRDFRFTLVLVAVFAITPLAWGQLVLTQYPNGNLTLPQVLALSMQGNTDGVQINQDYDGDLEIPSGFTNHALFFNGEGVTGRIITVNQNSTRIARTLTLINSGNEDGELKVIGGVIGTIESDAGDNALPICSVSNYAVVFENVKFNRYSLQNGDMYDDCVHYHNNLMVTIDGYSTTEVANNGSQPSFSHYLNGTVDFISCEFNSNMDVVASGCTQVEFCQPLVTASNARIRFNDMQFNGYTGRYELAPIVCTSSVVHVEETTVEEQSGEDQAGFLWVTNSANVGGVPGLFFKNVTVDGCTGKYAGALRLDNTATISIEGCTFSDNTGQGGSATASAGALRLVNSQLVALEGTAFTSNLGVGAGSLAGAVYATGTPWAKLDDCTFTGNSSPTASNGAGAAHFFDCASVEVEGGSFTGNNGWVGGLLVNDSDTPATKRGLWVHGATPSLAAGTQFTGNIGVQAGGILVLSSDNVLVEHATFSSNSAYPQDPFSNPRGAAFCSVGSLLLPGSGFTSVGLDSCVISANSSDVAVSFSESQAWVRDCRFENHVTFNSSALRVVGSVTGTPLGVQNNRFTNNGTCIRLEGGVAAQGFVRNNLFEQQWRAVDMGSISVPTGADGLRIDGNTVLQSTQYALYFRSRNGDIHVQNNILWNPSALAEISAELPYDQDMPMSHNTLSSGMASIQNITNSGRIHAATTWSIDPQLLASRELKWNHVLMDKGTATGAGELLAYDFDLTPRDIGWHPVYDVKYLTTNWTATNPAKGWYQVNQNMSFTGPSLTLLPGSVIRVSPNRTLGLATGSANGSVVIGNKNGARTALVGDIDHDPPVALSLTIGPVSASQAKTTTIEGTLIHAGFTNELVFQNLNLTLDNAVAKIASNVDGSLFFKQCKGEVVGYDATLTVPGNNPNGIAGIKIFRGSFGVNKCKLDGGTGVLSAPLYVYNNVQSDTLVHQIRNCTLDRGPSGSQTGIYLNQSVIRLTGTTINNFPTYPIYQYRSSTHLEDDAYCQLQRSGPSSNPLIWADDGHIWLCNGFNNFIRPNPGSNPPFVVHTFSFTPPPVSRDWSGNYWSHTCGTGLGETPIGRVPSYVAANSTWLNTCVNLNQWVDHQPCQSPGTLLLASGVEKELDGDLAGAQADYQAALELGTTESATEASLRLKSLGSQGEYGADSYESIRTGLLAAADQVATQDPGLATLYACNAWVVEAEHGDFQQATHALETLRDAATTPQDRFNAALALEEAQIVGTPAGLDAAPAERDARREQATKRLFDLLAQGPGAALPTQTVPRPEGMELGNAYPNPFNPVTMLPITLTREQKVSALVFNVLGQQVATLLDGRLAAGTHHLRFDGRGLASGLYLIQVHAEDSAHARKVMLLQ
jgi:hypothetical protein